MIAVDVSALALCILTTFAAGILFGILLGTVNKK